MGSEFGVFGVKFGGSWSKIESLGVKFEAKLDFLG
jgi:hypothetical protein